MAIDHCFFAELHPACLVKILRKGVFLALFRLTSRVFDHQIGVATVEDGNNLVFDRYPEALTEAKDCQAGIIVKI